MFMVLFACNFGVDETWSAEFRTMDVILIWHYPQPEYDR